MTLYSLEDFLGSMASTNPLHPKVPRLVMFQDSVSVDFPADTPYALKPSLPIDG